jgi:hypothetical protein
MEDRRRHPRHDIAFEVVRELKDADRRRIGEVVPSRASLLDEQ